MGDAPRFGAREFRTLLNWLMVSDPFPLSGCEHDRMVGMLNEEANERGYSGWVEAYHEFEHDE